MKRLAKMIAVSAAALCLQFAFAANSLYAQTCPPKDCPKPCPPKPCKPCPPVCLERGYPDTKCCIASAYNEPADFELSPCPWNFWVDASFTYWMATEDCLDLAVSRSGTNPILDGYVLYQETEFKPGFKVGLGMDFGHDHWSGLAEYTWFRSRVAHSWGTPPTPSVGATDDMNWRVNNWPNATANTGMTNASSTWHVNMDLLDVALTRPYYQGTHLIIAPLGGIRAQWIRQKLRIAGTPYSDTGNATDFAVFHSKSYNWSVGPRAGFQGKWHLGWGFRFEGDAAGDILFTRFTKVSHSSDPTVSTTPVVRAGRIKNYNTMSFGNDFNLGIGWGDYFDCRNYHFDLLLTYDFQIFWGQNMMRDLVDLLADASSTGAVGNLNLQGLTLKAQFDF